MRKCLDDGDEHQDTKFNAAVRKTAEECRNIVDTHPPKPPCQVAERQTPTQYTFCQHNLRTEYRRKDGQPAIKTCPCGVKARTQTPNEKLAETCQCISRKLSRYFEEPRRCDPMSVCCRMFGGPKYCPNRHPDICACQTGASDKDKFSVNYPPNRLTTRTVMHDNPECRLFVRCDKSRQEPRNEPQFRPDYNKLGLTEKFYSRYERISEIKTPQVQAYEKELQRRRDHYPRDHYCVPYYSNQVYGWFKGKKLLPLENCSNRTEEKVLANLRVLGNITIVPIQMNYCYCKDRLKNDHWKIV